MSTIEADDTGPGGNADPASVVECGSLLRGEKSGPRSANDVRVSAKMTVAHRFRGAVSNGHGARSPLWHCETRQGRTAKTPMQTRRGSLLEVRSPSMVVAIRLPKSAGEACVLPTHHA
ncbi:MAG: hypothetical protein AVDCRST_MAG70-80 [uncultured Thermomicrobiales bacterium]|uniref:Uncharacterized protein n=1 Tax=uncultured Thermomicrobiales bacterium TaxID=1645740 RepID=A0A6J4U5S1_9BACT|nr:MAG: hypothetical protein AVDCRST_MAG70-80 [uncultured Thermomicrobiales bacterium]